MQCRGRRSWPSCHQSPPSRFTRDTLEAGLSDDGDGFAGIKSRHVDRLLIKHQEEPALRLHDQAWPHLCPIMPRYRSLSHLNVLSHGSGGVLCVDATYCGRNHDGDGHGSAPGRDVVGGVEVAMS